MNHDLEVAHPHSGPSFSQLVPDRFGIWRCWFLRRGKTGVPGEKPLGARERTNIKFNPHIDWNLGYVAGRQVLSPLPFPCLPRKAVKAGE